MKKYISNSVRSFAAIAAICLTTSIGAAAQTSGKISTQPETAAQINYIGSIDEQPVFAVAFNNKDAEDIYLTLKDEDGYLFYAEKFNSEKFYRKFLFEKDEIGDNVLTLTFSSKRGKSSQSFQISKSVRTVTDVAITEVAMR